MINLFAKYNEGDNLFKFYPEIECENASSFFNIIRLVSADSEGLYFFDSSFIIKKAIVLGLYFNFNIDNKDCVRLANFLESFGIDISSSFSKVFFNQKGI